jgi:hypothetical protein
MTRSRPRVGAWKTKLAKLLIRLPLRGRIALANAATAPAGAPVIPNPAAPPPKYKMPSRAPTAADLDNRERFRKLSESSLSDVRAAAEKWRTGLAALITLVTGGLLIKGPESANDLTRDWRIAITILAGGGIAVAIVGLWRALKASAGVPQRQDMTKIVDKYKSVLGYEVAQANDAANELRWARLALIVALPALGAALLVWWWAPIKPASNPAYVEVDQTSTGKSVCGTLKSGDNGHMRVQVAGQEYPTVILYTDVANVRVKASC